MLGIDESVEAESHDRTSIDLPGCQHNLSAAVLALGKPTVIVLLNGGMLAIEPEKESAPAIIEGETTIHGSASRLTSWLSWNFRRNCNRKDTFRTE